MKKIISLLLAATMTATMFASSFAAVVAPIKMTIGSDKDGTPLVGEMLTPGEEYSFPLSITLADNTSVALDEEYLKEYSIRVSKTGQGNTITSIKPTKIAGDAHLTLSVKAGWPSKETEEQYTVKLVEKASGKTIDTLELDFTTGYAEIDDVYIDALGEGDYVEIDQNAPVFTKEQLAKIARINKNKKVTFTDDTWKFTVNVTDDANINMSSNNNVITEVIEKYPENNLEFLSFPAGTQFAVNGRVELDVASLAPLYKERFYVYRYYNGKLTPVAATFDTSTDVLYFDVKTLGRFVVSDKQIKDSVVIPNYTESTGKPNPGTGAAA